jgi:hypothetical protein
MKVGNALLDYSLTKIELEALGVIHLQIPRDKVR